jgi:hypothetical protein
MDGSIKGRLNAAGGAYRSGLTGLPGFCSCYLERDMFDVLIDDIDEISPLVCFFKADKTP